MNQSIGHWVKSDTAKVHENVTHFFFYRQLDFSSEPGVANEFWENEAESCLVVA